jgi:NADH:ubiquinone oxidoreductase subunit F (NADH-binding)
MTGSLTDAFPAPAPSLRARPLAGARPHLSAPFPAPMTGEHPTGADGGPGGVQRLLPAGGAVPVDLGTHLARYGALPDPGNPRRIIAEVAAAGLTGRGGAAFPVHRKLAAAADRAPHALVAGNGAEGEPASRKDASLLWISPHLVLDGLQVAAWAAGSRAAVLYVRRNYRLHQRLAQAIADRAATGLDAAPVELREAPDRFLAGEESALASRLAGRPARPAYRPVRGLPRVGSGQPVLVQNVETLAHLALIARYGAGWFRAVGTDEEPGSMLATLHLPDERSSVAEVPLGVPLADLLGLERRASAPPGRAADGGGDGLIASAAGPVQAVLVGGYHGAWLPAGQAARLPLANAALRPLAAAVGAGVMAALPADRCGIAETARVARYLALESAGQCGPCVNGLPRIAAALDHLAGPRPDPSARADLDRWAGLVAGRGACHHPDGTIRFIGSALRVFAAEAGLHEQGRCTGTNPRPFLPLPSDPPLDEENWS